MTALIPTKENIEDGTIREGRHKDFKEQLNLDTEEGKEKFIDQIAAFLNVGGDGHLIVGVKEKGGAWEAFRPLPGDGHDWAERIQSMVRVHLDPAPNGIEVHRSPSKAAFCLTSTSANIACSPTRTS